MKLTICQNYAYHNGKLFSLIVSETLEEQQDLDKKEKKPQHQGVSSTFSAGWGELVFTGKHNLCSIRS